MKYQVRLVEEGEMGFKKLVIFLPVLLFSLQMQLSHKIVLFILIKVLAMTVFQEQKFVSCWFSFPLQIHALKSKRSITRFIISFITAKQNIYNNVHSALYLRHSLIEVWICEKTT